MVYDPQMDNSREEVGLTESIADVYREGDHRRASASS
jgi:hypothetical protein